MKKTLYFLLVLVSTINFAGCSFYLPGRLPSLSTANHPNTVRNSDVAVLVRPFNCEESRAIFDCALCAKKVQPVYVIINNQSNNTFDFRKINVVPDYLKAHYVAEKKCFRSILQSLAFLPPPAVRRHKINKKIYQDFQEKEIVDSSIGPGEVLSGVMFLKEVEMGRKIIVPLFNSSTGEKLTFEFKTGMGSSGILIESCIEETSGSQISPLEKRTIESKAREMEDCGYRSSELAKRRVELEEELYRRRLKNVDADSLKKELEVVRAEEYKLKSKCPGY